MISPTQEYWVEINDRPVGVLQSFEERLQREVKLHRGCGSAAVTAVQPGAESYAVSLKRLRTDRSDAEDFWNLHGFSLTLISSERRICYTACEVQELHLQADEKGSFVEEVRLVAYGRRVGE